MEYSLTDLRQNSNNGYVSLEDFHNEVKRSAPTPYHSKFSFTYLIEEFQNIEQNLQISTLTDIITRLKLVETYLNDDTDTKESQIEQEEVDSFMLFIFHSFFFKDQMGFVKGPFENYQFRFQTEAFQEILTSEHWEIKTNNQKFMNDNMQNILMAGIKVLNTFYDQKLDLIFSEGMTLRDRRTKLEKHYKFNIQLDYMEVKAVKPLKKLSKRQIHELLNNLEDASLWLKHIPPENFVFEGFVIGLISDDNKGEILSIMKVMAANEGGKSGHENDLDYLELLIRSYLEMPDLHFGVLQTLHGPWIESLTWNLLRKHEIKMMQRSFEDPDSAYGKVLLDRKPLIIEDLQKKPKVSDLEKALLEKGYRSLLLAPLTDDESKIVSIFELASPEPYRFSQLALLQLEEVISLIEMGTNKFIQEMNNSINLTIQEEFTSIHPSVEWKFRNVASKYYWERVIEEQKGIPDSIVFKDVYPLYGQADIVGSSKQRNTSIEADLIDNLERLYQVLLACRKVLRFHLLDVYAEKVSAQIDRLRNEIFVSSDESVIVELLTEQIHPLLRKLRLRFPQLPQKQLDEYFDYLDSELDIVYRHRKAYEDSVSMINQTISHYLLQEEDKMQQILPHYFEKFQTDGVEYNIYLGQSILEKGEFDPFYLHDFRLWQLIVMCEISRLVEREAKNFPVTLTTAQLIFVYNSTLSVRFQMDEKQFDIDGAYNVRYEILKKRIDKAYIKGTNERLTQGGKIAIVWLQEKDRQEYQEYLEHLVRNGYISPDIEDHELERMQGVEGLKAIRVKVLLEN